MVSLLGIFIHIETPKMRLQTNRDIRKRFRLWKQSQGVGASNKTNFAV